MGIDDLLIFARNLGLSADQLNLERPPLEPPGANDGAFLTLDVNTGNSSNDGVTDGFVGAAGSIFDVELFVEELQAPIVGARIRFELDPSLMRVINFSAPVGTLQLVSDFGVAAVATDGAGLGAGGFLGTLTFEIVSDATDVPFRVGVESASVMESGSLLRNELDTEGAGINSNSQGGPQGPRDYFGPVGVIEPENDLICVEGPSFRIDRDDLTFVFPDGTELPASDVAGSGLIGPETPVAVEIERVEGDRPIAVHIRVLEDLADEQPNENLIIGRIDGAEVGVGIVQAKGRCFLLTDGTEVFQGEAVLSPEDLNFGDEVRVEADPPPEGGDLEVAVVIERLRQAPPEPVARGRVTDIDFDGNAFEIVTEEGIARTVFVDDETEFVIRRGGGGDDFDGDGDGFPDGTTVTKQADGDPNADLDDSGFDEPASFADLQVGDAVGVFGEENGDDIFADRVVIQPGGGQEGPVFFGRVVEIDFDAGEFAVEGGDGATQVVLVTDETEFVIRRRGSDGGNGDGSDGDGFDGTTATKQADGDPGDEFGDEGFEEPASFEDLQVDDPVEVFGVVDGDVIVADRVVIKRGDEGFMPPVSGRVAEIDFEANQFEVEDGNGASQIVSVTDETEFVIQRRGPDGDGSNGDEFDNDGTGTKQADDEFDSHSDDPGFEEPAEFGDLELDDFVDVFGGHDGDVIVADLVVIKRGDDRPVGPGPVGAITEISFDESFICIRGPVIRLEHPELPVEFDDGLILSVRDAEQRAELARGTPVAIDVEFREDEPPVAHRIKVVNADELDEVPPNVLLGIVDEVNVREGSIRLADLCFRLIDGTVATDDGTEIALEDLIPRDIVRVTPGQRQAEDDLPTAEEIERIRSAPVPIEVVSFTLGGQVLEEDAVNPPLNVGLNDAELVFNDPLEFFLDDEGEPEFEILDIQFFPPLIVGEDILDTEVSDDETTVTATFDLPENVTYQGFFGHTDDGSLANLQQYFFGTTDLQDVTVSGSAFHPDGRNLGPFTLVGLLNLDFLDAVGGLFKPATKAAVLRAAKQIAAQQEDGLDEFDEDLSDDDGDDLEAIVNSFVRVAQLDESSSFEVPFVPDGDYFLFVVDVRDITSFIGFQDEDGDGIPDVLEVAGQSISGLEIPLEKLRFEVEEFHEEGIVIAEVDRDGGFVFVRTPEGLRRIDVSEATVFDREGEEIDLAELNPGTRVNAWGTFFNDGSISLFELEIVDFEGPRAIFGRVLSIQLPEADHPGRMSLAAAGFRFDEFGTRVEDSSGRRISALDLRQGLPVLIKFRETEEMGQRGLIAEGIRVLRPGEPAPPPEPDLFVGHIAEINFNERLIFGAVSLALFEGTEYFDRDGNETEVQPGSDVRVIPTETRFGIAARRVDVIREPGERAPEEILSAVFLINGEEVPVAGAVGVPLDAEARVTFNVPLSDRALDAVEVFVYSQDTDQDVEVQKSVDADGNLVLEMTLSADDVYDGEIALESGAFFFATFTTSDALPLLLVESIDPEDGATNVGTVTTISVTFNRELDTDGDEVDAELFILPFPDEFTEIAGKITRALQDGENGETDFGRPRISDDHLTISVDVELRPDQSYLVVIPDAGDVDGFRLNEIFKSRFSTGEPPTSTVAGSFVFPPNAQLDPVLRNGAGFVYMLPAELEDLEGDEPERLGVAFDVTQSGDFEMPVSAGTYIVEGFVFIEEGPDGVEQGLVGTYQDDNGEPLELVVGDGVEITDIEIRVVSELRVTATRPFPGQTNLPAGVTTLSVQFSEPLAQHRGTP